MCVTFSVQIVFAHDVSHEARLPSQPLQAFSSPLPRSRSIATFREWQSSRLAQRADDTHALFVALASIMQPMIFATAVCAEPELNESNVPRLGPQARFQLGALAPWLCGVACSTRPLRPHDAFLQAATRATAGCRGCVPCHCAGSWSWRCVRPTRGRQCGRSQSSRLPRSLCTSDVRMRER